jgi:hypothetical protein
MGRFSDFRGFSYITFFRLKQGHLSSPPTGRGFQVRFNNSPFPSARKVCRSPKRIFISFQFFRVARTGSGPGFITFFPFPSSLGFMTPPRHLRFPGSSPIGRFQPINIESTPFVKEFLLLG